jgi:predicted nucleic acid-binding protein
MITSLVDTDIVIDAMRKYPPAQWWFSQQSGLGISGIVWAEVLQGVTNTADQKKAFGVLEQFERVEIEDADVMWTIQALSQFHLKYGLQAFDALIASASYRLQVPLYTRNIKHFRPTLGNLAIKPY